PDAEYDIEARHGVDRHLDASLPERLEGARSDLRPVLARQEIREAIAAGRTRSGLAYLPGLLIRDRDARTRHDGFRGVADRPPKLSVEHLRLSHWGKPRRAGPCLHSTSAGYQRLTSRLDIARPGE